MEKGRSSSCLRAHRLNKLINDYPLNFTTEMGEPRIFRYDSTNITNGQQQRWKMMNKHYVSGQSVPFEAHVNGVRS